MLWDIRKSKLPGKAITACPRRLPWATGCIRHPRQHEHNRNVPQSTPERRDNRSATSCAGILRSFWPITITRAELPQIARHGQILLAHKCRSPDKTTFKALIEQYYAAWNTGDPAKAAPFYAKDADLIFYDITPLKYKGWAEYDAGVRNVLGTFASAKFVPQRDLNVTRHGSIAWTTVTWHLSGKKKTGETVEMDGRHTAIWENRVGKWLIVHEHFSAPLQ